MKQAFKQTLAACALALVRPGPGIGRRGQIGVLGDQSGMMADLSGKYGVEAVKMAVEDFGGTVLGKPIEVISADHQNKVDIGVATARRWYENDKVDLILDVPNSAIALAVQDLTRQMKRVVIFTSAGSADLTGRPARPMACTGPTTPMPRHRRGQRRHGRRRQELVLHHVRLRLRPLAGTRRDGGGQSGQALGSVRHPIANADFSSFLLQAQASKAQVIGLASGSGDTINSIKQAFEFGIMGGKQRVAALFMSIVDVRSVGLEYAQGLNLVEPFYWDLNDQTRVWSERYFARTGRMPSMVQASNYSAAMHYLNAVKAAGTDASEAVLKKMHDTPINDFMTENGRIREDGRVMRDLYLFRSSRRPSPSATGTTTTWCARSPPSRPSVRWRRATARW